MLPASQSVSLSVNQSVINTKVTGANVYNSKKSAIFYSASLWHEYLRAEWKFNTIPSEKTLTSVSEWNDWSVIMKIFQYFISFVFIETINTISFIITTTEKVSEKKYNEIKL